VQSWLPPSLPKIFSIANLLRTIVLETFLRHPPTVTVVVCAPVSIGMPVSAPAGSVLRFGIFELDLRAGELRKRGVKLRLQGQPLQVLATLLKRAGDLVTREELRDQIWPADTFVDFDHSLHNAIARIREVLGDSAQKPRYIETLPRRGYRFVGQIEEFAAESADQPENEKEQVASPYPKQRTKILAILTAAALTLALARWALPTYSRRAGTGPVLRSIAVLPLQNLSGDASQEFFVDGMTEELITDLAKLSSLRVTSRTSVMRYKGSKKGLPEIARELNVDGIVEGSVMRSGNRVRVTAQLLNAPKDQHLWAESYERNLGDVLSLQSEVARAIAEQVRVQITPEQRAKLLSPHPVNPEAYDAYLRGRYYLTTEFTRPEQLLLAQRYLEESIAKDSTFALAYAGLADSYLYLAIFRHLSPEAAYPKAKAALTRTLELDDSIGETHDTLGVLSWRYERNWAAAEREFKRAIALAPNYSCAHEDHSLFLGLLDRRSEALAEVTKSLEIDHSPGSALTESGVYYQLRDYPALLEATRRGVLSNPKEWMEHYYLGVGYEGTGKKLEAVAEYQKALELSGGDQDAAASLAHAYVGIGKRAEAEKILRDLDLKSKTSYISPYVIATIYAALDEKEKAFAYLEKAYQERSLDMTWHLKADARIDNLRSDPRFQSFWQRTGFSQLNSLSPANI
jgi:TolB-like protein/DNA-binding winged helix-turn-helix (wHTH) protein